MKKYIFLAIAAFVLFVIFSPSSVDVAIDNPTDSPVTVTIDELTVEVPAKEVVWVEMGKGEHTVELEDGSTHPFDYSDAAYFLNPTQSSYLVEDHFYGDLASQLSYSASNPDRTVTFMGMELAGQYTLVDDLITPVTWDVGARENMPESVSADSDESYVVMKKLIDEGEFTNMIISEMQNRVSEEVSQ